MVVIAINLSQKACSLLLGVTFRQLQVFVEAVELGSFRACAERLGVTQVSVSGHVRAMERMIGRALFERRRGTTSGLTDDGRRVYRHAVVLLQQMQNLMDDLGSAGQPMLRRRLIVAGPGYVSFRLSQAFAEFGQTFPEWQIEMEPNDQETALELVDRGRADLGFVLSLEGASPANCRVIWRERLGLYVGRDHPLANRDEISAAELSTYPLIYLSRKDRLRATVDGALARVGVVGNPTAVQTGNATLARRTLMQGHALGCIFAHLVKSDVESGLLRELPISARMPGVEASMVVSDRVLIRRAAASLLEVIKREVTDVCFEGDL
jgi:DNA-binding transcriptional LysR family regulator